MTHYLDAHSALETTRKETDEPTRYTDMARRSGLPLSTVRHHLTNKRDMKIGTFIKLWKALGYTVTIWCEGEQGKRAYVFDDQREENPND